MPKHVMMKCGHTANGEDEQGRPMCLICGWGFLAEAEQVADVLPDLAGRQAKCTYCNTRAASDLGLAFFEYRPTHAEDRYYCGCLGWG